MNQSETIAKLSGALSKAQGQLNAAKKDASNPFFKSKYADLESVWEACREALNANELAVIQTTEINDQQICLVTTLTHSSGEWIRSILPLMITKQDPQSMGSALTYARRYALAAIVGVVQSDDDGEAAMKTARKKSLTESQIKQLEELSESQEAKEKLKQIMSYFKVKKIADIPVEHFNRALSALKKVGVEDESPAMA